MGFSGCTISEYPSVKTLYRDYQAARDSKKEKHEAALSGYYSLLEDDNERAATHSNIGVILNKIQKSEEALKSLQHALKLAEASGDHQMIFKIRYNLGVYYGTDNNGAGNNGKGKKIPEALQNYQAALDIVQGSQEIKTNIELLLQSQKNDQQQSGGQGEQKDSKPSDQGKDDNKDDKQDQKKESSPKYQPRPFKGDQLSEGDVKKILNELKSQEQKIRANFEKKEKKGKSKNNEKDW